MAQSQDVLLPIREKGGGKKFKKDNAKTKKKNFFYDYLQWEGDKVEGMGISDVQFDSRILQIYLNITFLNIKF